MSVSNAEKSEQLPAIFHLIDTVADPGEGSVDIIEHASKRAFLVTLETSY